MSKFFRFIDRSAVYVDSIDAFVTRLALSELKSVKNSGTSGCENYVEIANSAGGGRCGGRAAFKPRADCDCKASGGAWAAGGDDSGSGGSGSGDSLGSGGGNPPPGGSTPQITVGEVFPSLSFRLPTVLKQAPGDASRWFVGEKPGVIRVFANNPNSSSSTVFLDISAQTAAFGLRSIPTFR